MAFATESARWRALVTRDANADGHFFYSVRSTKIYCRPICPGRLARRANVGFYETYAEAEAAGFRACKRCKPNAVLVDPQEKAVDKACMLIDEASISDGPKTFKLQDLAKKVGLTPRYFHKIFKDKTGLTPKEYADRKGKKSSSPSTTPVSSTTTDASVQSWDVDTFDFNDLIDYSNLDLANHLTAQSWEAGLDPEFGFDASIQPWTMDFHSGIPYANYVHAVGISPEPFGAMPVPGPVSEEKLAPSISTFELDAAALLNSDNLSDLSAT